MLIQWCDAGAHSHYRTSTSPRINHSFKSRRIIVSIWLHLNRFCPCREDKMIIFPQEVSYNLCALKINLTSSPING